MLSATFSHVNGGNYARSDIQSGLCACYTFARVFVYTFTRFAQTHRSIASRTSRNRPRKRPSVIPAPAVPAHSKRNSSCGLDIGGARVSRHFQEAESQTTFLFYLLKNLLIDIAKRVATDKYWLFARISRYAIRTEQKARFTLEHVVVGVFVRVVADAADRRGQQAHFRDGAHRCRAHVLDTAERHRAGPRIDTVARGAAWPVRSRSYWRALAARPRGEPIDARESRGLARASRTSKSCQRKATSHRLAESETSLSPGGGYSRCHLRRRIRRLPQDRPDRSRNASGPGGRGLERIDHAAFAHRAIPSGEQRRDHSNLTDRDAATPTLSLRLDWHCPARPSRVQAYSERPLRVPHRFYCETRRRMTRSITVTVAGDCAIASLSLRSCQVEDTEIPWLLMISGRLPLSRNIYVWGSNGHARIPKKYADYS